MITGGVRLTGEVTISGAKNAAVAIIPAAIFAEEPCIIENVPTEISDVSVILRILHDLGADIKMLNKNTLWIDCTRVNKTVVPYELARQMRASYYMLGVLLGRFHSAEVSMPGGCNFGVRPIDQHLKGFKALGADWSLEKDRKSTRLNSSHRL